MSHANHIGRNYYAHEDDTDCPWCEIERLEAYVADLNALLALANDEQIQAGVAFEGACQERDETSRQLAARTAERNRARSHILEHRSTADPYIAMIVADEPEVEP